MGRVGRRIDQVARAHRSIGGDPDVAAANDDDQWKPALQGLALGQVREGRRSRKHSARCAEVYVKMGAVVGCRSSPQEQ